MVKLKGLESEEHDCSLLSASKPETSSNAHLDKDYFMHLPDEIHLKIFIYISPEELCKSVSLVCKRWWFLSKDSALWTKLSVTITSQSKLLGIGQNLLHCQHLNTLKIHSLVSLDSISHSFTYRNLRNLDFSFCRSLTSTFIDKIVYNCREIEILNLERTSVDFNAITHIVSLPNLWSLNLNGCASVDDMCITSVARNCLKLELLNIDNIPDLSDESICELADQMHRTLVHLFLGSYILTERSIIALSSCEKLQTLGLSFIPSITEKAFQALSLLQNLTWLKIGSICKLNCCALEQFLASSNHTFLSVLDIDYEFVTDRDLQNLSKTCKNLKVLSLSWCWHITDVGLTAVIEGCRMLRWLSILDNHSLTSSSLHLIPVKLPDLMYLNIEGPTDFICDVIVDLMCLMTNLTVFINGCNYERYFSNTFSGDNNIEVCYLANRKQNIAWTKVLYERYGKLQNLTLSPQVLFS